MSPRHRRPPFRISVGVEHDNAWGSYRVSEVNRGGSSCSWSGKGTLRRSNLGLRDRRGSKNFCKVGEQLTGLMHSAIRSSPMARPKTHVWPSDGLEERGSANIARTSREQTSRRSQRSGSTAAATPRNNNAAQHSQPHRSSMLATSTKDSRLEEEADQQGNHLLSAPAVGGTPDGGIPNAQHDCFRLKSMMRMELHSKLVDSRAHRTTGNRFGSSRTRTWHELLLGAICSDDVGLVADLLSKGVLNGEMTTTARSQFDSSSAGPTRTQFQPSNLDINKKVFGMCVRLADAHVADPRTNAKVDRRSAAGLDDRNAFPSRSGQSARRRTKSTASGDLSAAERLKRLRQRYSFVSYGAPLEHRPDSQWLNAATCLHVAVWSNANRVTRYLMSLGAVTSVKDELGAAPHERGALGAVSNLMGAPPVPTDVQVLNLAPGSAQLTWTIPDANPPVKHFEVRNVLGKKQSWRCEWSDVQVFARSRHEPKVMIARLLYGAIESKARHSFDVRACNSVGVWGGRSQATEPQEAPHWLDEWAEQDEEMRRFEREMRKNRSRRRRNSKAEVIVEGDPFAVEQRRGNSKRGDGNDDGDDANEAKEGEEEEEEGEEEESAVLRLGAMVFGEVPKSRYFKRVAEIQCDAATRIQAHVRGLIERNTVATIRFARDAINHRFHAAARIQAAVRGFLERTNDARAKRRKGGRTRRSRRVRQFHEKKNAAWDTAPVEDDDRWLSQHQHVVGLNVALPGPWHP